MILENINPNTIFRVQDNYRWTHYILLAPAKDNKLTVRGMRDWEKMELSDWDINGAYKQSQVLARSRYKIMALIYWYWWCIKNSERMGVPTLLLRHLFHITASVAKRF